MNAYHFVSVQAPRLTARLSRAVANLNGVTVVLDLEDSLWDVDDAARTRELKAAGRRNLVALAQAEPGLFTRQRVGVRINRLTGEEAAPDIDALAEASRSVRFDTLVLTKVGAGDELVAAQQRLRAAGVRYGALLPIVETESGVANLEDVCRGLREVGGEAVVFGLYDYALDAGWWPIPEPDEAHFWTHADPFIETVERFEMTYVQPPFFQLHQPGRFTAALARLAVTCRRPAAVLTLGREQASIATQFDGRNLPATSPSPAEARSIDDATARAHRLKTAYETSRRDGLSFAIDGISGEFVSPHVYLAAARYLGQHDG